jgi:hypothetical protein
MMPIMNANNISGKKKPPSIWVSAFLPCAVGEPSGRITALRTSDSGEWCCIRCGGEQTRVLDQPIYWWDWALARNGIYFVSYSKKAFPNATLEFFEFATHRIIPISTLDKPSQGLALSPDGRSILYARNEFSQSNIMLVKNFR